METNGEPVMSSTAVTVDQSSIKVNFPDGSCELYHFAWLRDSCKCYQCVSPLTLDRKLNPADIDYQQLKPVKVIVDEDELRIDWLDGLTPSPHPSVYSLSWMELFKGRFGSTGFTGPSDGIYGPFEKVNFKAWDVPIIKSVLDRRYSYSQLMGNDFTLRSLIGDVLTYGIAFISGAASEKETILTLARRIAYERITGYGSTFDVIANPDPKAHFSYSSAPLELHTDLSYRERVPGVQMLHCLRTAGTGGQSTFADGFHCASQLKAHHPELFNILTQPVLFSFYDSQRDIWFRQKWPVIIIDSVSGEIKEINISYFSMRAPLLPLDQMETFFTAFKQLFTYTRAPENRLTLTLAAGDIAIFNNRRVLHGRTGYDAQKDKRFLQGCYMDLDELYGLYEKLSRQS